MIGSRIAGRYDVEAQIGIGGMGVVYRAHDTRLMRHVALKVIAPHLVQQEAARTQFLREAQALAGLMHPNIVTVFDLCEDEATQTVFIVMELLRGSSLRHCMTSSDRPQFSQVALPLCRALEAAHTQGFLHRDIKPENVFVCADGTIKLMDFGLARLLTANSRSQASLVAGTLAYMAPEQLKGEKADFRADLYSLGILFYEYLSGVTPFNADNPGAVLLKHLTEAPIPLHEIVPNIASGLESVIHRLLEKSPEARFGSATALRAALEQPLANGPMPLAGTADATVPPNQVLSATTVTVAVTAETPTPLLPVQTVVRQRLATALFLQPGGKVKPAFLVGSVACFGAIALLFVGPIHRRLDPVSANDSATAPQSASPRPPDSQKLTQQARAAPIPSSPVKTTVKTKPDNQHEIDGSQRHAGASLDELIKQQEQTRLEVERLEKLVAVSDSKRKAAETRAATAEAASAHPIIPDPARPPFAGPFVQPDSGLKTPVQKAGLKMPVQKEGVKMPPTNAGQAAAVPAGLPDALAGISTLHPHDQFEFRTKSVTRSPDGALQVQVHNAQACYVYFYLLQESKNQAVFLSNQDSHLAEIPQHNVFTGISLRLDEATNDPVKLLLLASVKPVFGLPLRFILPEAPRRSAGDVSSDKRFTLLHAYRDQIVTTLQSNRVQRDGKNLEQDDLIVRFLRTRVTDLGTLPPASPTAPPKNERKRTTTSGTRTL